MAHCEILWVDDNWDDVNSDPNDYARLKQAMAALKTNLEKDGHQVDIETVKQVANAVAILSRGDHDFTFVIIDYRFEGQPFDWTDLFRVINEKGIPFTVFSAFYTDFQQHISGLSKQNLFLGCFAKDDAGIRNLIQRLGDVLVFPPIRFLLLSDLHYDTKPINKKAKESQSQLIEGLLEIVQKEHERIAFDAIFIGGDLAARNPLKDLLGVRDLMQGIIQKSIGERNQDRLFLVPGNHDIVWDNFAANKIAKDPWAAYLDLYSFVYSRSHPSILGELSAWDRTKNIFNYKTDSSGLTWNRNITALKINVIGLATPVTYAKEKGKGSLSKEQLNKIRENWKEPSLPGEIRIALMHHNPFEVLSISPYDKKNTILNAGQVLHDLLFSKCSLILSGHTHTPLLVKHSASVPEVNGTMNYCETLSISTGTTAGLHPAKDRPRSFSIVRIHHRDPHSIQRKIEVQQFQYDSTNGKWVPHPSYQNNAFSLNAL